METEMEMELYILGPAFGLPSIDAECNAAVALLQTHIETGWSIIPTHPQHHRPLPSLHHGDHHISGFASIARYISSLPDSRAPHLSPHQRADSTALTTFIASHAHLLLDISLYVASENYSTTRSAFTPILPAHANYLLPPARRKAARTRTQHLGISSIDVDDVHEDLSDKPPGFGGEKPFEPQTRERASLLLGQRATLAGLLRRPEHSAVFKLHALGENFFAPLLEMLGEGPYFLGGGEASAVDCLAYGYLSLMLYPDLPQGWLQKTLRTGYPKLVRFVQRVHAEGGMGTEVADVMSLRGCKDEREVKARREELAMRLPWAPPAPTSILEIAATIAFDLYSRIPYLGPPTQILTSPPSVLQRYYPALFAALATSLGLSGYCAFATGLLVWPHGEELQIFGRKRLADYGHLGAALAGMRVLGSRAGAAGLFQEENEGVPLGVGVEVEGDGVA